MKSNHDINNMTSNVRSIKLWFNFLFYAGSVSAASFTAAFS